MDPRAFTAMAARPSVPPILTPSSWDSSGGDQVHPVSLCIQHLLSGQAGLHVETCMTLSYAISSCTCIHSQQIWRHHSSAGMSSAVFLQSAKHWASVPSSSNAGTRLIAASVHRYGHQCNHSGHPDLLHKMAKLPLRLDRL